MRVNISLKIVILLLVSFVLSACGREDDSLDTQYSVDGGRGNGKGESSVNPWQLLLYPNLNIVKSDINQTGVFSEEVELGKKSSGIYLKRYNKFLTQKTYPLTIGSVSPPFSIKSTTCGSGLSETKPRCKITIEYSPKDISTDLFKILELKIKSNDLSAEAKVLGAPGTIYSSQEEQASSTQAYDETKRMPLEVKNTADNSLNYQLWSGDENSGHNFTLTNNTKNPVTNLSLTSVRPPEGVSYDKSKLDRCTQTDCQVPVMFQSGELPAASGHYASSIGATDRLRFTYGGFNLDYALGSASAYSYGKEFFVDPTVDLGNFNRYSAVSNVFFTQKYSNIIISAGDNGLSVSTNNGLTWRHIPGIYFIKQFEILKNHILIATRYQGLLIGNFNDETGEITEVNKVTGLSGNDIRAFDFSENNILIATSDGLFAGKYVNDKGEINNIIKFTEEDNNLPSDTIQSVAIFEKRAFITTPAGIAVTDPLTETGDTLDFQISQTCSPQTPACEMPHDIWSVTVLEKIVFIASSSGLAIHKIDETGKIGGRVFFYNKNNGLPGDKVNATMALANNHLLILTDTGLVTADIESTTGLLKNFSSHSTDSGLAGNQIHSVSIQERTQLMISTNNGFSRADYNTDTGTISNIVSHTVNKGLLPGKAINSIRFSTNHMLFSTNEGLAVATYHKNTGKVDNITLFTTKNGLPENAILDAQAFDNDHHVLILARLINSLGNAHNEIAIGDFNDDTGEITNIISDRNQVMPSVSTTEVSNVRAFTVMSQFIYILDASSGGYVITGKYNSAQNTIDKIHAYWNLAFGAGRTPLQISFSGNLAFTYTENGVYVDTYDPATGIINFKDSSTSELIANTGPETSHVNFASVSKDGKHLIIGGGGGGLAPGADGFLYVCVFITTKPYYKNCVKYPVKSSVQSFTEANNKLLIGMREVLMTANYGSDTSGIIDNIKYYKQADGLPTDDVHIVKAVGNHILVVTSGGLVVGTF